MLRPSFLTQAARSGRSLSTKVALSEQDQVKCLKIADIEICGALYQSFREKGRTWYRDAPTRGIKTSVTYFDSGDLVGRGRKTVLAISGAPGNYTHFKELIGFLTEREIRVISPNMPSLELTKVAKHFRHSPEERCEFVKAILADAEVSSMDVLASHSAGSLIAVDLLKDANYKAKAVAMFNPIGFEAPHPYNAFWGKVARLWNVPAGRNFINRALPWGMKATGNRYGKGFHIEDIILPLFCFKYNDWRVCRQNFVKLSNSNLPLLMSFADNDYVMDKRKNAKLMSVFESLIGPTEIYDGEGNLEERKPAQGNLRLIRTRRGGHFSFSKHSAITNQALFELL